MVVRAISAEEHLAFLHALTNATSPVRSVSFLQTPAWGQVKSEWRAESIGWFDGSEILGAGLVLYRQLPKVKRYLAYLPEGPVLDWAALDSASDDLAAWLDPMVAHLKRAGAFGIRMGPPVVTTRWSAEVIKAGLADESVHALRQLVPSVREPDGARVVSRLRATGWQELGSDGGFAAGQPRYNFQLPLLHPDGSPRTEDEVLRGMNQLWRRNIKRAAKLGVQVSVGDPERNLAAFHDLYVHTAERDHFTPRPLTYFQKMFEVLGAEDPERIRLYLAHHEGDLVAATIRVKVGGHVWYSYGASSSDKRDVRGSNAIQWQMISDAIAEKAAVYDMRGITDTLDATDPHVGLIQFKVGTGGEVVEYAGEWDLPLNRLIYKAFSLYLARRG
ncbi:MAG: peptidoglycan bridge formation glycyltransferase FemA/FemB family protein [Nocardioidaceae bacterium]|nr:MAG: peptidoglycan bridge formation glycyltransferase FemA/FemB family protein [Nocardioidaceae bacterium]